MLPLSSLICDFHSVPCSIRFIFPCCWRVRPHSTCPSFKVPFLSSRRLFPILLLPLPDNIVTVCFFPLHCIHSFFRPVPWTFRISFVKLFYPKPCTLPLVFARSFSSTVTRFSTDPSSSGPLAHDRLTLTITHIQHEPNNEGLCPGGNCQ